MSISQGAGVRLGSIGSEEVEALLEDWVEAQLESDAFRAGTSSSAEIRSQSEQMLGAFVKGVSTTLSEDIFAPEFDELRSTLAEWSINRAKEGYSPSQTASSVFSLKEALLSRLETATGQAENDSFGEFASYLRILDRLGLFTFENFVKGREEVIKRQTEEIMELSTPVVKIWDGVVAVPLIGTLDSARTQVVMESLLQEIVDSGSQVAIIDITGVPTVDTMVAQHLLKAVVAARLMGAECIISGIRPGIAQTIVHLGIDLGDVVTKSTLADALSLAVSKIDPSGAWKREA